MECCHSVFTKEHKKSKARGFLLLLQKFRCRYSFESRIRNPFAVRSTIYQSNYFSSVWVSDVIALHCLPRIQHRLILRPTLMALFLIDRTRIFLSVILTNFSNRYGISKVSILAWPRLVKIIICSQIWLFFFIICVGTQLLNSIST